MGLIGYYAILLYCDHPTHPREWGDMPGEFTGETRGEAVRAARAAGWSVSLRGRARRVGLGESLCRHHRRPRRGSAPPQEAPHGDA